MKHAVVTVLAIAALAWAPTAAAADPPGEWNAAVAAMQSVDPTIPAPTWNPQQAMAVGGGVAADAIHFAFSALDGPAGAQGRMTIEVGAPATIYQANVTCLAVQAFPFGGGIATILGTSTDPTTPFPLLVFLVTDSGDPSGAGDMWTGERTLANGFPCEPPQPGGNPVTAGEVFVQPGS